MVCDYSLLNVASCFQGSPRLYIECDTIQEMLFPCLMSILDSKILRFMHALLQNLKFTSDTVLGIVLLENLMLVKNCSQVILCSVLLRRAPCFVFITSLHLIGKMRNSDHLSGQHANVVVGFDGRTFPTITLRHVPWFDDFHLRASFFFNPFYKLAVSVHSFWLSIYQLAGLGQINIALGIRQIQGYEFGDTIGCCRDGCIGGHFWCWKSGPSCSRCIYSPASWIVMVPGSVIAQEFEKSHAVIGNIYSSVPWHATKSELYSAPATILKLRFLIRSATADSSSPYQLVQISALIEMFESSALDL